MLKEINKYSNHTRPITSFSYDTNKKSILSGSSDGHFIVQS